VQPGSVETEGLAWPVPGETGPVVTAEVLNGTGRTGLARIGTRLLRSRGIDVIASGNADAPAVDTRILLRRAAPEAAEAVRRALGIGAVETAIDSTRRLDVTVILGQDFVPVTPLHP
jgi:hypothetical protein